MIDWTMGGTKPEREGQRCENSDCRQVLMINHPEWKVCAACQRAAGDNPADVLAALTTA